MDEGHAVGALGEDSRVEFKEAYFKGGRVEAPQRETMADELVGHARVVTLRTSN